MKTSIFFLLGVVFISILSCKKDNVTIESYLQFVKPSHFPEPHYTFENNEYNYVRFDLGRDLFYETMLSSDSTISCASCHAQVHGFADHNIAFSVGVNNQLGTRNAPAIINMAWSTNFMWDGGVNHLEIFPFSPITNPLEMNETMAHVVQKLNNSEYYRRKFQVAYGVNEITDQVMFRALAQFMALLISSDSKYDKYLNGTATFTASEENGLAIFRDKCVSCHEEPLFTDHSYRNNGIDSVFLDEGREKITLDPADLGKFKVPTLRNIAMTYPYMHDGRFYTLSSVIDHYSEGIVNSSTRDPLLPVGGFQFTSEQKTDLINFLKTLTDQTFLINSYFSEKKK